jgi:hypothetical protein
MDFISQNLETSNAQLDSSCPPIAYALSRARPKPIIVTLSDKFAETTLVSLPVADESLGQRGCLAGKCFHTRWYQRL